MKHLFLIFFQDDLNDENSEFKRGGKRQMFVIARADYCPETTENWRIIFDKLGIFDRERWWRPFYIAGDLKCLNQITGKYFMCLKVTVL